ncbi:MAG TPA: hypothetical protein VEI28_05615 [Thermodesulfovibrionales bacterium]|nr:hypothetical protein [Thermodesulfovibrionales bacterium]
MKILHLLNDGPTDLSEKIIEVQSRDNQVKVVNLAKKESTYEALVDAIFASDRVISW